MTKSTQEPLARFRFISFISIFSLFTSFLLFLLVALSLPIIKPVYLFSLRSTAPATQRLSLATELRFGVWGVCASSALDQPTLTTNPGLCFGPKLGYKVPDAIANLIGISPTVLSTIETALLVVLVLHPIAAGLTLLCLICSLFLLSHAFSIFALIVTIMTAIMGSVALAIDLALVIVAKKELAKVKHMQFEIVFGNAVWMIVVSMAFLWLAVITISARACFCFGVRRYPPHRNDSFDSNRY